MPAAPYVVAAATSTFAAVSMSPTATSIGSRLLGARSDLDDASATTAPSDTAVSRAATTAQDALSSAPASIPTK
jgi:hypothetical protein